MHSRPSPKIRELEEVRSTAPTSVARRERKVIYPPHSVPCYVSGATASRLSQRGKAGITVRIDNAAPHLDLRTQLVDDPAKADFVLVDGDAGDITCRGATAIENIRVDNRARKPDLTAALWRAPVRYKIFMRSARFSDQDAAALFAVF